MPHTPAGDGQSTGPTGSPAKERAAVRRVRAALSVLRPDDLHLGIVELAAIDKALEHAGDNRTHAARLLGISVRTLQRKLKALGGR